MNSAAFSGYVLTTAEAHPLQTRITFVLTDFQPNSNKQAIPRSEAANIIATAKGMPIKINFDGKSETGHARATPIGPITDARLETIDGVEVIVADAILWKSEYAEIDAYLHEARAEGKRIGTSWELYYKESEEKEGVSWLTGIVMAGTAIVAVPAYGNRTPILSLAQDMDEVTNELISLRDHVSLILSLMDELYMEMYEEDEIESAMESIAMLPTRLKDIVEAAKKRKKNYRMSEEEVKAEIERLKSELEAAKAERDRLATEKAEAEAKSAREKRITERTAILTEAGAEVEEDHYDILAEASDDVFNLFVKAFGKPKAAQAEERTITRVPATIGGQKPKIDTVADALSKYLENK